MKWIVPALRSAFADPQPVQPVYREIGLRIGGQPGTVAVGTPCPILEDRTQPTVSTCDPLPSAPRTTNPSPNTTRHGTIGIHSPTSSPSILSPTGSPSIHPPSGSTSVHPPTTNSSSLATTSDGGRTRGGTSGTSRGPVPTPATVVTNAERRPPVVSTPSGSTTSTIGQPTATAEQHEGHAAGAPAVVPEGDLHRGRAQPGKRRGRTLSWNENPDPGIDTNPIAVNNTITVPRQLTDPNPRDDHSGHAGDPGSGASGPRRVHPQVGRLRRRAGTTGTTA